MSLFTLHPQLETDSFYMLDLKLSQLRLSNQKNIPWLILVPRREGVQEIYHLPAEDRVQLMEEVAQASQALMKLYAPDKINVAALGNIVPQLHVHVIARFKTDEAWPHPVWGKLTAAPYTADTVNAIKEKLNSPAFWR